jgi:hypothetical protein
MIIEVTRISAKGELVWINIHHIVSIHDRKGGGSRLQLACNDTWLDVEEPSPVILERIYKEEKHDR